MRNAMTAPSDKLTTDFDMADPHAWEEYGVHPDIALAIAQGFPRYWLEAAKLSDLDHANNIAEEMASQERKKHFQALARTKFPVPFQPSPIFKVPAKQKQLFDEWLRNHHPSVYQSEPRNPFLLLEEKSPNNSAVSFDDWHTAATELATGFVKFGKRVEKPRQAPPIAPERLEDALVTYECPSDMPPQVESVSESTPPVPPVETYEPPDEDPQSLDLSEFPGRFEWDDSEGGWRER